jgi:hypothetical protein
MIGSLHIIILNSFPFLKMPDFLWNASQIRSIQRLDTYTRGKREKLPINAGAGSLLYYGILNSQENQLLASLKYLITLLNKNDNREHLLEIL